MKLVLAILIVAAMPAVAFAHHSGGGWFFPGGGGWSSPGSPAPAPDLASGLPAAIAVIGAFAATRFKRRR
jgi:hypothetical protein